MRDRKRGKQRPGCSRLMNSDHARSGELNAPSRKRLLFLFLVFLNSFIYLYLIVYLFASLRAGLPSHHSTGGFLGGEKRTGRRLGTSMASNDLNLI